MHVASKCKYAYIAIFIFLKFQFYVYHCNNDRKEETTKSAVSFVGRNRVLGGNLAGITQRRVSPRSTSFIFNFTATRGLLPFVSFRADRPISHEFSLREDGRRSPASNSCSCASYDNFCDYDAHAISKLARLLYNPPGTTNPPCNR